MARSRKPHTKPAKSTKPAKPAKPRARRVSAPDPEELMMQEAAVEMIEVMSCPVLVADDQAARIAELALDAEETRALAALAGGLHPSATVAPVLADLVETLERHARELGALLERLLPLVDHDEPHDHVELDDDAVRDLLLAMFGDPREDGSSRH